MPGKRARLFRGVQKLLELTWLPIIALTLLGLATGAYLSISASPVFSSYAVVGLQSVEELNESENNPEALLASELSLAQGTNVVDAAENRADRAIDIEVVKDQSSGAMSLRFDSTSPTAELAAQDAEFVAEAYTDNRVSRLTNEIEEAAALLEARREALVTSAGLDTIQDENDTQPATLGEIAELGEINQTLTDLSLALLNVETSASITQPAKLPSEPEATRLGRNLAVWGAGGLLLGLLVGIALLRTDRRVRRPSDISDSHLPLLGVMPKLRSDAQIFVDEHSFPEAEAAISRLSLVLERRKQLGGSNSLLVTSPTTFGGTTTVAGNLAIMLGQTRKKTILIDGAFRQPTLHDSFGIEQAPGITDHIIKGVPLPKIAQRVDGQPKNLIVLPGGTEVRSPQKMMVGSSAKNFFSRIKDQADWVIVDAPPVLGHTDALMQTKFGLSVVLVVRSGFTKIGDFKESVDSLNSIGAEIMGVFVVGDKPEKWQEMMGDAAIDLTSRPNLAQEKDFWGVSSKASK